MLTTTLEKREIRLTEMLLNNDVTLVQMPDMVTFDFHVTGENNYFVHFLDPNVFGQEFATLYKGYNLFTVKSNQWTECYLFEEAQLRNVLSKAVYPGTEYPRTGPIVIPPR